MSKKNKSSEPRKWPDDHDVIRRNYDLGEGFYNGIPGGGAKSIKEFIDKRRKKTRRKAKEQGKVVAFYLKMSKLAHEYEMLCLKG
jgi:hypothetical protein